MMVWSKQPPDGKERRMTTATKTAPIRERYIDDRYVNVAELRYFKDSRGQKRHTVVLEYFDKMGEDVRVFKFATVEEARGCWRAARRNLIGNRGLDRV
jgi:hypothetical protein